MFTTIKTTTTLKETREDTEKMLKSYHASPKLKAKYLDDVYGIDYFHIFKKDNPFGGLTFATKRLDSGEFFVGVAHCSENDRYTRKIGREQAEEHLKLVIEKFKEDGSQFLRDDFRLIGFMVYEKTFAELFFSKFVYIPFLDFLISDARFEFSEVPAQEMKDLLILYYDYVVSRTNSEYPELPRLKRLGEKFLN